MKNQSISSPNAPQAIGPYSQAVATKAGLLFCSGQIGLDPKTQSLVSGGTEAETHQALKNLSAVLQTAGGSLQDVVKTTVYLTDFADYPLVNKIYAEYFGENKPARAAVGVAVLPAQARVEIEAIATLDS